MQFSILSSGSSGNATVVATGKTAVLVDCGVSIKSLEKRAEEINFDLQKLNAILVTHEHGDHAGGVAPLARKYGLPIYLTHGTAEATQMHGERKVEVNEISPHNPFHIGDITILPTPVPHDAREPCQFVFEHEERRLGILTDIGSSTPHVEAHYQDCHALVLEFNHDRSLLADCSYPESVKERVGGRWGHFSNEQASGLLQKLKSSCLEVVVAAHLSENSNEADEVSRILELTLGDVSTDWKIAQQNATLPWIKLN